MTLLNTARHGLHPPLEPYRTGMLPVSKLHTIYYEESGNPRGKPVLMVHGGPGGGSNATMRRFHDPAHYRIVLFDQRGCGRSTPSAELDDNTTWDLVADMEQLRAASRHRRAGSCSAARGARRWRWPMPRRHPERVSDMVLRGIFTLRRAELEWFYQEGAHWIFPEAWEPYRGDDPAGRARRHDRGLLPPPDRPRPGRTAGRSKRLEHVGRLGAVAVPRPGAGQPFRLPTPTPSPSRGSSAITSSTADFSSSMTS